MRDRIRSPGPGGRRRWVSAAVEIVIGLVIVGAILYFIATAEYEMPQHLQRF